MIYLCNNFKGAKYDVISNKIWRHICENMTSVFFSLSKTTS